MSLVQVDEAARQLTLANYAEIVDPAVDSSEEAMDTFAESFFEGAGAQPVAPTDGGELEDGTLWRLYDFDLQGFGLSMILTMDQTDDGAFVVSAVVSNTEGFSESVASAQEQISLDGEQVFLEGIGTEQLGDGTATPAASTPVS